jgi:prepilin-type processing-associated H-X9-DG protein
MPRAFTAAGVPTSRQNQDWGWAYQILPYLESEALWRTQRERRPAISVSAFRDDTGDAEVARTQVPEYFCPTRRGPQTVAGPFGERAAIDYAGNAGLCPTVPGSRPIIFVPTPISDINGVPVLYFDNHAAPGLMVKSRRHESVSSISSVDRPLRMADISDGLSHTFLIAEKRVNAERLGDRAQGGTSQPGDQHGFVSGYGPGTIREALFPPMPDYPRGEIYAVGKSFDGSWGDGTLRDKTGQFATPDGFGASHVSGFNVLFADGSVRHLRFCPSGDDQAYRNMFTAISVRSERMAVDLNVLE